MVVSGEQNIRGLDIQKLVTGFADEASVFKEVVQIASTSAREVRWYSRATGILDSTDTTGITASKLKNVSQLALPQVVERSWTRNTSYVRKFFVESPWISEEDIKDSDVDVLTTHIADLANSIASQVDAHIYDVISESQSASNINSTASTAGWDAGSGQDPIKDILVGKRKIRTNGYIPEGGFLLLNATDHQNLLTWLISTKGASIPNFSSEKMGTGVIHELLGLRVKVSENVVADSCLIVGKTPDGRLPGVYKEFTPITSAVKVEEGIGRKVRVWEEGICILQDPKAIHLTTNTVA